MINNKMINITRVKRTKDCPLLRYGSEEVKTSARSTRQTRTHPLAKDEPSTANSNNPTNITNKAIRQQCRNAQLAQLLRIEILHVFNKVGFEGGVISTQFGGEGLRVLEGGYLDGCERGGHYFDGGVFAVAILIAAIFTVVTFIS